MRRLPVVHAILGALAMTLLLQASAADTPARTAAVPPSVQPPAAFDFRVPGSPADPASDAVMRDLAARILPVYQEDIPERYLANLSAIQALAGNNAAAVATRDALRERRGADGGVPDGAAVLYDSYVQARSLQEQTHQPLSQTFAQAYGDALMQLGGPAAYAVTAWRMPPLAQAQQSLQQDLERLRNRSSITQPEAIDLLWLYFSYEALRTAAPQLERLQSEDLQRRYVVADDVLIKASDGTRISATVVRPRDVSRPIASLFEFTLDAGAAEHARESAAYGYVGVVAYTRGSRGRHVRAIPFEYDGQDARSVINWIAKQPWSDGRVGMYGVGYSAFTAWAAAKKPPAALKAIATSAATAPGIDFPMAQNIFQSAGYRWALQVSPGEWLHPKNFGDDAVWRAFTDSWYRSGRAYSDLDDMFGMPNKFFHRWLNHPSYDGYWQGMIPFRKEFARIRIPVLATTGYYDSSAGAALYYFTQHAQYNPQPDQTLLIGPYDGGAMLRTNAEPPGAVLDAVAQVNLRQLRYQWFDYLFNGGSKPALLKDRVNYELMGANEWRHVGSLSAMADGVNRYYLAAGSAGGTHVLAARADANGYVEQAVDLANRDDVASGRTPARAPSSPDSVLFIGEPLQRATEFTGLLSGQLDFLINKQDVDLRLGVYALLPSGEYVPLFAPAYEFRASYAHDRVNRRLLKPGVRQQLEIRGERVIGCKLPAGARLVISLGVVKRPNQEINYGTGNNVSDDALADADGPVRIRWFGSSYLDLPLQH